MKPSPTNQENEPEILDEATGQAIKEGLESEENGHYLTMEQAVNYARERRKVWQTSPQAAA